MQQGGNPLSLICPTAMYLKYYFFCFMSVHKQRNSCYILMASINRSKIFWTPTMSFQQKKVSLNINSILTKTKTNPKKKQKKQKKTKTKTKKMLASIQGKSEDTYGNSKWGLLIRTNTLKLEHLIQMCSANVEDFQNSEKSNF